MIEGAGETAKRGLLRHPLVLMLVATVMVVAAVAGTALAGTTLREAWDAHPLALLLAGAANAVAATFAYWLFTRFVERQPMHDFARNGAVGELGLGLALGAGAMMLSIASIAALGGYSVTGSRPFAVLVPVLGMAVMPGIWEEILFRGILFRFTEQWLGSWVALAFTSALFGFAHFGNPGATWLSSVAIALEAGILLGAVYMLTRRLWAAIGLHMAWNFTQGGIFGVAVSGGEMTGILDSRMQGDALLTGGAFGAEASVPAMVVCTAMGLAALYLAWQRGHFVPMRKSRGVTG